jgi:hypothetical protein
MMAGSPFKNPDMGPRDELTGMYTIARSMYNGYNRGHQFSFQRWRAELGYTDPQQQLAVASLFSNR